MAHEKKVADLVTVFVTHGLLRATVIRGLLESAGIPVMLSYESIGPVIGITMPGLGRVEVRVPAGWAQAALDLLHAKPRSAEDFSVAPDLGNDNTTT